MHLFSSHFCSFSREQTHGALSLIVILHLLISLLIWNFLWREIEWVQKIIVKALFGFLLYHGSLIFPFFRFLFTQKWYIASFLTTKWSNRLFFLIKYRTGHIIFRITYTKEEDFIVLDGLLRMLLDCRGARVLLKEWIPTESIIISAIIQLNWVLSHHFSIISFILLNSIFKLS